MTAFRIVFHGTGYELQADNCEIGGSGKLGFYVAVNVEADEAEQAIQLAYGRLVGSEHYMAALGEGEHPDGVLTVDQCYELSTRDPEDAEVSGFIFYPGETGSELGCTEAGGDITH